MHWAIVLKMRQYVPSLSNWCWDMKMNRNREFCLCAIQFIETENDGTGKDLIWWNVSVIHRHNLLNDMDFTIKVVIVAWKWVTLPSKPFWYMFDLWLIVIRETVWKVVKARIDWCEWQIHSAGGFTIVPTDPVPVTSIVSFVQEVLLLSLRLSVTGDAIDRYEQCRRLWLCQRTVWSVTDRARGRVTSLPWSPARAAGSKVLPNLQTILFSTN